MATKPKGSRSLAGTSKGAIGRQAGGSNVALGAHIQHSYLIRHQEVIAVNRRDLQDILDTDLLASGLSGVGLFFMSGSSWLLVESLLNQISPAVTPAIVAYGVICICGILLLGAGFILTIKKRNKITSIFEETESLSTTYSPAQAIGLVSPLPQLPQDIESRTQQ